MVNAILFTAAWLLFVLVVGLVVMSATAPRTSLEIARTFLDTVQGIGERVSIALVQARSWSRRRRYVGQHRAPSFTVTAPVMVDQ